MPATGVVYTHSRLLYITTDWKLLTTMLPTPEEKHKIHEATIYNPYLPLGSAEQFLMMLLSMSELPVRLQLWIFKLDYENMEKGGNSYKEVASVCSTNGRRTRVLSPDGDVQAFLLASAFQTLARMKWMVPVNVPISQTRMMMWHRNVDRSTLEAGEKVLALEPIHVKICMASCCDLNMVWGKFSGVRYKTHTCEQEKNECRVHSNRLKGLKLY
ncbi:uncharacterized protein [Cherax quadricarinatus]|uniref:uncharacterized protein isoform X3 n=1 Tax=Cherax quadricarinatus TaxID=27406 RepID=UPI00387E73E5